MADLPLEDPRQQREEEEEQDRQQLQELPERLPLVLLPLPLPLLPRVLPVEPGAVAVHPLPRAKGARPEHPAAEERLEDVLGVDLLLVVVALAGGCAGLAGLVRGERSGRGRRRGERRGRGGGMWGAHCGR